jgi:hypothetical protein
MRNILTRTIAWAVVLLLAPGYLPATVGRAIDTERVKTFRTGETTRAEVEAVLGLATYETMDGRDSTLTWTYSERNGDPSGPMYRSRVVSLRFGPDGVMKDLYDVPGARGPANADKQ